MKEVLPSISELQSFKAFFFDFDGVILESAQIKTEAFGEMYRSVGLEDAVLKYHLENQGVSRYEKFHWIAQHLENRCITDAEVEVKAQQFSDLILTKVLAAPFVPGVENLLRELNSWNIPCLVASGTPQAELRRIVSSRGIGGYFQGVFGSPDKKNTIVERECQDNGWEPKECIFLGDAITDYRAAQVTGCKFFARFTDEMSNYWHRVEVDFLADDFEGLNF